MGAELCSSKYHARLNSLLRPWKVLTPPKQPRQLTDGINRWNCGSGHTVNGTVIRTQNGQESWFRLGISLKEVQDGPKERGDEPATPMARRTDHMLARA